MTSSRIRSGGLCVNMASASSPLVAVSRRYPSGASMTSSSVLFWRSSSTIRMRAGPPSAKRAAAMSRRHAAPRDRPPHLGSETFGVELGLFHDGRHEAVQLGAVLHRDPFGGDDEDRDMGRFGTLPERLHDVEAVDV